MCFSSSLFALCIACALNLPAQAIQLFELPPTSDKAVPWTGIPKTSEEDMTFRFAIVADRTGGEQPGVFKKAIQKLNLMQPDFVISVGDLIDGYTENVKLVEKQWAENDRLIGKLQMPFFYVAGNHDMSNFLMRKIWTKRFGPSFYHFIYHKVLFLCLNTEDAAPGQLSSAQLEYFKNVLNKNMNVRWTMVFMHRPLWDNKSMGGFEKIEKLLTDRPHTVFSGHTHNYLYDKRGKNKYFVLATTGGNSALRGAEYGELNHIMWVTMTAKEPVIANLELKGVKNEALVVREDYALVQQLRLGTWLKVDPIIRTFIDTQRLTTNIRFINNNDQPLHIYGSVKPWKGFRFFPDTIDQYVAANSTADRSMILENAKGPVNINAFPPPKIELTAEAESRKGKRLRLSSSAPLLFDWKHTCRPSGSKVTLDGCLEEWADSSFIVVNYPQDIKEGWGWHGRRDSWFRFAVTFDAHYLFIALEAHDPKLILENNALKTNQDKFILNIKNDLTPTVIELMSAPALKLPGTLMVTKNLSPLQLKINSTHSKDRIIVEIALPLELLNLNAKDRAVFRLNVAYMDLDISTNTKPSVLWWRPVWGSTHDYKGSGKFYMPGGS